MRLAGAREVRVGLRLFVAVELAPEVKKALVMITETLKTASVDVKWVEGGNHHITLHFLGEVAPDLVTGVHRALEGAVAGMAPFQMKIGGLGAFPNLTRPRTIWAGAVAGEELARLHRQSGLLLENLLGPLKSSSHFSPHVTLGRVRSPRNLQPLNQLIQTRKSTEFGCQEVTGISLMESRLFRQGPVYTCLSRYLLLSH